MSILMHSLFHCEHPPPDCASVTINEPLLTYHCYSMSMSTLGSTLGEGFPGGSESKVFACNAGDLGLILWSGRYLGEGNGNPLQYSCLENPMDRGAW